MINYLLSVFHHLKIYINIYMLKHDYFKHIFRLFLAPYHILIEILKIDDTL